MKLDWNDLESIAMGKLAVRNGKCFGDIVWASIWCRANQNVGDIYAKIMGDLASDIRLVASNLHLCSPNPHILRGVRGDIESCRLVLPKNVE